jgi:DNA-3-methyladenine glycosylase II
MARNSFELAPIPPFRLDLTVWTLRRRAHNIVDRWDGTTYRRVLPLPNGPVDVEVTQSAPPETPRLQVAVSGRPVRAAERAALTSALERLLGLRIGLTELYKVAAIDQHLGPLVQRFRGMKPPRFASVFEGAINAMACQQVTLTLGIHLLNRLAVAHGATIGEGDDAVHAFPLPENLAQLSPEDLREFGFSHQKGRAMIELAQSVVEGRLDLEALTALPDDEAVQRLCKLRGVGRWSAEYVLLRGLGRTHVFPGDDVGARKNLKRWLHHEMPLDYDGVRRVLSRWDGYGGLVYFHLLLDRLEAAGELTKLGNEAPGEFVYRTHANAKG